MPPFSMRNGHAGPADSKVAGPAPAQQDGSSESLGIQARPELAASGRKGSLGIIFHSV